MKHSILALVLALSAHAADLTYTETTQLTGGSMKGMLNLVSRLGGNNLSKGVTSTVVVSGDKMASRSGDTATIIDVGQGTMTSVDYKSKKYSTITFQEMMAAYEQMPQAVADAKQKNDVNAKVDMKVTAEGKGAGPTIAGTSTNLIEVIVKTTTHVQDPKTKEEGSFTSTMRLEEAMGKPQGWETVQDFYRRMAAKMPIRADASSQMMRQAGLTVEALNEAGKKLGSLDGMPMRSVSQMIGDGPATPGVEMPSGKDVARGALEGITGGFGGFGRKKKEEPKAQPKDDAKAAPAGPNVLLEFTTTVQSIQPGVANAQAFVVPAGFKQEEHPMKRLAQQKK